MKKLTDVAVERTSVPRAGFKIIWDSACTGLGLKLTAKGRRLFVLQTVYPGHTVQSVRTLGTYPELALAEARAKAQEWYGLAKRGIDPAVEEAKASERARRAAMLSEQRSFGAVAEAYIERELPRQRRGERVRKQIEKELLPYWGGKPINEIDRLDVVALLDRIMARPARAYAHNVLQAIRGVFNWAIARGVYGLETSPCDRLKPSQLIGPKQFRIRVVTDSELAALWLACGELGYPYGPLIRMLALTGCRTSEVVNARWSEVDMRNRVWVIPAARYKSNAQHAVPLCDDLIALLESLPRGAGGDFLFSSKRNAGSRPLNGLGKIKIELDKMMGVSDWVYHDIRRSVRTRLSELRVAEHVAELAIGHSRKGLARVYDQHRFADEIREALDAWALRLRQIVDPNAASNVVRLRR
jgi:integrase